MLIFEINYLCIDFQLFFKPERDNFDENLKGTPTILNSIKIAGVM